LCASSGTAISLSEDAQRRLVHYCRRAIVSRPDYVFRPKAMPLSGGRSVRYVAEQLRAIVWSDEEVRTALLEDDFDSLAARVTRYDGLGLLDLCTAMELEREMREPQTA
jgi:hypothetical protein